MVTKIKHFFISKTKKGRVISIVAYIILLYALIITFCLPLFFKHKYVHDSFVFYSNSDTTEFRAVCNEIVARAKNMPIYNENKNIRIFFTNSLFAYRLFSPTAMNAKGITKNFGKGAYIVFAPTNFSTQLITSGAKEYNTRNCITTSIHEISHVYLSKGHVLINRLYFPEWIEEGLCEYYANDSSFDTEKGLQLILEGKTDPSGSFKYYIYRVAVTYLVEKKKLSLSQVLSYKGRLKDVLEEFRLDYKKKKKF